ncbi:uncharacterized protein EV154DRAFT_514741 [Mucor mucedo]|uniref:uncharacterized protein n=1 Tax=Mucor mucedo TaxID=29922 RepID=UPI00221FAB78|nr:uncharacterized protein EV154DRAFT_514741 [Mucor mucedo]KAI7889325.1 hypothetical protein EV154DRAFT_514741 [Mucor mucedo]
MYRFTSVAIFLQYTLSHIYYFYWHLHYFSAPYFLISCNPHIIKPKHTSISLYIAPLSTKYSFFMRRFHLPSRVMLLVLI